MCAYIIIIYYFGKIVNERKRKNVKPRRDAPMQNAECKIKDKGETVGTGVTTVRKSKIKNGVG